MHWSEMSYYNLNNNFNLSQQLTFEIEEPIEYDLMEEDYNEFNETSIFIQCCD